MSQQTTFFNWKRIYFENGYIVFQGVSVALGQGLAGMLLVHSQDHPAKYHCNHDFQILHTTCCLKYP